MSYMRAAATKDGGGGSMRWRWGGPDYSSMGREDRRAPLCSRYDGGTALFDVGRKGVGLL